MDDSDHSAIGRPHRSWRIARRRDDLYYYDRRWGIPNFISHQPEKLSIFTRPSHANKMLLRISTAAPRQYVHLLPQACLCPTQTRGYRNQLYRNPQVFYQNIVLTDGSSFKVMTSSPRKTYRLTRDKFNNPVWTGRKRSTELADQNKQLYKFRKSFSATLLGEAGMRDLSEARRQKLGEEELSGDAKSDAAEELFDMLKAEDAYVPTRGKESDASAPQEAKKKKGVRT